MNVFVNFITVLVWVWGAITLLSMLLNLCAMLVSNSVKQAETHGGLFGRAFLFGIPAYAWLIARYLC